MARLSGVDDIEGLGEVNIIWEVGKVDDKGEEESEVGRRKEVDGVGDVGVGEMGIIEAISEVNDMWRVNEVDGKEWVDRVGGGEKLGGAGSIGIENRAGGIREAGEVGVTRKADRVDYIMTGRLNS